MSLTQGNESAVSGLNFLVTGGSQGLGATIVRRLLSDGASHVVFCGRDRAKGLARQQELDVYFPGRSTFETADLAQVTECRRLFQAAVARCGSIAGLVNNAADTRRGTIVSTDEQLYDEIFSVNAKAPFFLTQEMVTHAIGRDAAASIVNIGSIASYAGQPYKTAYCASKAALVALTKNVAFAAARNDIRVNCVNPGWMDTEGEDQIQRIYHGASSGWQARTTALPKGRLVSPGEVAGLVAFLLSSQSGLISGSCIDFDQSVIGAFEFPSFPSKKLELDTSLRAGCPQMPAGETMHAAN